MDRRVKRILETMNERLPERASGQTFSKSVNLSPARLRQLFKKETGFFPSNTSRPFG